MTFSHVKKLLFFNRIPVIDKFVIDMISEKCLEITIVRTIFDLREHIDTNQFNSMLLNVDDQLTATSYLTEISRANKQNVKVIVFGQYEEEHQALIIAGVNIFLTGDPVKRDFESAMD